MFVLRYKGEDLTENGTGDKTLSKLRIDATVAVNEIIIGSVNYGNFNMKIINAKVT